MCLLLQNSTNSLFVLILLHSWVSLYYSLRVQFMLTAHLYHAQLFFVTRKISKQVFKNVAIFHLARKRRTIQRAISLSFASALVRKCHNRGNRSETQPHSLRLWESCRALERRLVCETSIRKRESSQLSCDEDRE